MAGPTRLQLDDQLLAHAAEQHGTSGRGERRRRRHARERVNYHRYLAERTRRRIIRPRPVLVPEGVVDPVTGELLDPRWAGWNVTDPYHPTFPDPGAQPVPHRPATASEAACA
ncbi:hypothetical protein [Streptomyces sp. NBC_01601]|uniref:hypothetical protein n=1 Tax=Streptomyces sp. NBC_01601 TaxID=2975892 RepID=UPI002E29CBBC|nr:hypothetical protein [Streptomyces sp. NBC_01601]